MAVKRIKRIKEWRGIPVRYRNAGDLRSRGVHGMGFCARKVKSTTYNVIGWVAEVWCVGVDGPRSYSCGQWPTPRGALNSAYDVLCAEVSIAQRQGRKLMAMARGCKSILAKYKDRW